MASQFDFRGKSLMLLALRRVTPSRLRFRTRYWCCGLWKGFQRLRNWSHKSRRKTVTTNSHLDPIEDARSCVVRQLETWNPNI